MNTLNKLTFVLLLVFCASSLHAQQANLDKLPAARRDSMLIEIAKAAVLKYGPGYWREYKDTGIQKPEIRYFITEEGERTTVSYPELKNKKIYYVTFFYDKTKETLSNYYAARISIVAESGTACIVMFGNMRGLGIYEYEKTGSKLRSSSDHPVVPYEQAPKLPKIRPKSAGE